MQLQVILSIKSLNVTSFTQLLLDLMPCVTTILCSCLISRTFCFTLSYLIFIFFLWSVMTALHLLGTVHLPFVPTFEGQNLTHHTRQPWLLLPRCTKLHSQIWNQGPSTHICSCLISRTFCFTLSYLIFIFFLWSVMTALHLLGTVHLPFVPTFEGQNLTHHTRQPWLLLPRCTKLHSQIWNQRPSTHTEILILEKHFTRLSIISVAYFYRLVFYFPWFLFKSCKTSSHFKICFSIAFGSSGELSSWSGCVIYVVMLLFTSRRCNSLSFSLSASSVFFLVPRHWFPVMITLHRIGFG